MRGGFLLGLWLAGTSFLLPAHADVLARSGEAAGAVIARKSGEEALFIELPQWRLVDLSQDVVAGDYLRTNAAGNLAVLFADRTQMRLGRNTTLLVKRVGAAADSQFELQSGTLWGRAERGGTGLTVDTPAAAAAIRGTDWTLSVSGDTTSLVVLDGRVDLSNAFGSVSVEAGEAASATIGSAPTKTVLVDPDDREQMLFYFSIPSAMSILPASPMGGPAIRAERARIAAVPESARAAEDWLVLAEVSGPFEGPAATEAFADRARALPLTAAQQARLDLVDAGLAAADRDFATAARLYERALPGLDPERRSVAEYGRFFARSLAEPERREAPPSPGRAAGAGGALAEAVAVAFMEDLPAGIAVLKAAERRFPHDASLLAARARLALLVDDRPQVEEAIARALALDPDETVALETRSFYRAGILGDIEGAYADIALATRLEPGSSSLWNTLGLIQSDRGANREALGAFLRAVELEPKDPLARANLAIFLLDADQPARAREQIDLALAEDPSFDSALTASGRHYLQTGNLDKAIEGLLASTTANPADSQALLLLAIAYYERGERGPAQQALDNADRLDPNDPVPSTVRTAIAIDDYEADLAIASAQEALRRTRARGGDFAALSANRDAGSTLNDAFRLLNLNAWGRFYGDTVFDPFSAAGYFDQALAGSVDPFINDLRFGGMSSEPQANGSTFASQFQGFLLEPMAFAGRSRKANILRRPFLDVTVGGGITVDNGDVGRNGSIEVQAFDNSVMPVSIYGALNGLEAGALRGEDPAGTRFRLDDRSLSGLGFIGLKPTINDNIVGYFESSDFRFDQNELVPADFEPFLGDSVLASGDTRNTNAGIAWSHSFGYRNMASLGLFTQQIKDNSINETVDLSLGIPIALRNYTEVEQRSYLGSVNHMLGVGDLTLRYGAEFGWIDASTIGRQETRSTLFDPIETIAPTTQSTDIDTRRIYLDALYEITPDLKVEAAMFGTFLDGVAGGADIEEARADPRLGIAWSPLDGHYLRAGFLREASVLSTTTLSPVGVVGLQSNQVSLSPVGYSETFAARWDAEWTSRFFTALDYQRQTFRQLSLGVPGSAATIDLAEGRLDRFGITANLWLGGGFGAFATYAHADSQNKDNASIGFGEGLPFVPDHSARLGLTYVSPFHISATLATTYVGSRRGNEAGAVLDDYWTTDAFLTWEPLDKRLALELSAYNLLDETFEVAPFTPGWGRSFVGTLKVRF